MTPRELDLPFDEYRGGQFDLATRIAASDSRFIMLSAPTGVGKSLIYMTAAKLLGARTLVVTGTKGLQEQLLGDFGQAGLVDIRGHGNYGCSWGGDGSELPPRSLLGRVVGRGEGGKCRQGAQGCEYSMAVRETIDSDLVVTNYAYWMARERVGEKDLLGEFDLLVLDEAHRADDWLSRGCKWAAQYDDAREVGLEFPEEDNSDTWVEWAKTHAKQFDKLQEIVRASELGVSWIVERRATHVYLTPVWSHPWAEQVLFRGVDRVVLSSATLFKRTGKYLGLKEKEIDFLEVDSPFPREHRPFVYLPSVRVDYRMNEGQKRIWVNKIDTWIDERLDRKGVIHSVSYDRAQEIHRRSRHSEHMIVHRAGEVGMAVTEFRRREAPAILVSPAVSEGYDFAGDQAEWQIIAKVPFVYSKEPLTQARQKDDKQYGIFLAAQAIIQMAGRGVRSATDVCECAIADDHWRWFQRRIVWPRWFKSGWTK